MNNFLRNALVLGEFFKNTFKKSYRTGKIVGVKKDNSREKMIEFIKGYQTKNPVALNLKNQVEFMKYDRLSYWYHNIKNLDLA